MSYFKNFQSTNSMNEIDNYLKISENMLNYFLDDDMEFNKFFINSNNYNESKTSFNHNLLSFPKLKKPTIPLLNINVNRKLDSKRCFVNSIQSSNSFTKANSSKIIGKQPIPLKNINVNCYMNSAMQSLLVPFCDLSKLQTELPKQCHAFSLMKSFISSFENSKEFSIYDFIKTNSSLQYFGNELSWNKQEDAHEFLNQFLNKLDEELKKYYPSYKSPFTISYDARLFCNTCKQSNISQPNIINNQVILVDVEKNFDEMINNCYRNYVDVYKCDNCSKECSASCSGKFTKLPDYLVICFKRFGRDEFWRSYKIEDEIKIEENIKVFDEIDNKLTTYELISIVNHIGSVSCGHYYSYVKYEKKWFKTNDERIDLVNFKQVQENSKFNNYINIYRKL